MDTESFNGMGGNCASVLAGRFGEYGSGHAVRRWLAASNAFSSASHSSKKASASSIGPWSNWPAPASMSLRARSNLGIQHRLPVLKRPQGRTHDLADGLVLASIDEGGQEPGLLGRE